jgi:hypothetical protein
MQGWGGLLITGREHPHDWGIFNLQEASDVHNVRVLGPTVTP